MLVGLEHPVAFGDAIAIRYWEGDLAAYQVSARVSDPDPTVERTEVMLLGAWKTVELRRGQRIPMPRHSLVAEQKDETGKIVRRYQLVASDLSAGGCGVTGVGPPPLPDGTLYLRAGDDESAPWIDVPRRAHQPARLRLLERRPRVPPGRRRPSASGSSPGGTRPPTRSAPPEPQASPR